MLFRKKIEPSCSYCGRGKMVDDETVICIKKGIVGQWDSCVRFTYDPLKRIPPAPQKLVSRGFKEEDFTL